MLEDPGKDQPSIPAEGRLSSLKISVKLAKRRKGDREEESGTGSFDVSYGFWNRFP
jgi:hypothetical protein